MITKAPEHTGKIAGIARDERGAIMLTGLFMACFLIGALWFIIGIGDTIVFRDKMQEAADHGAFSSAALHAKGMNFISLCNLVMLVGTVVHIVLGVISDIHFAIAASCAIDVTCYPTLPPKTLAFEVAYRKWETYFATMSTSFKAVHAAQKTASYAYPAMGVAAAYQSGRGYGDDQRTGPVRVLAVSSSLSPGNSGRGVGNPVGGGTGSAGKEGLPVEAKPFRRLCTKVADLMSVDGVNVIAVAQGLVGVAALDGRATGIVNGLVGLKPDLRYCNPTTLGVEPFGPGFDSFWGQDGPYVVWNGAANGSAAMQTWAVNVSPKLKDTSESHVGIAAKQYAKFTKEEGALGYLAQAEFYFDCDARWNAENCNAEDNATFAIKWRARMRRLDLAAITGGVVGGGLDALTQLPETSQFQNGLPANLGEILGSTTLTRTALGGIAEDTLDQVKDVAKGAGIDPGTLDPNLGQLMTTPFH